MIDEANWFSVRFELLTKDYFENIHAIEGDGNCFYRCLARFMHGDENLYPEMKKLMKKYMITSKKNTYIKFKLQLDKSTNFMGDLN